MRVLFSNPPWYSSEGPDQISLRGVRAGSRWPHQFQYQSKGVVNGHINSFFPCVSAEIRRGGQLGSIQVYLAIAGDGHVLGSSVRTGSADFQRCLEQKVGQLHFPHFGAPRMGARFRFSAN